jgi:hypothetical protein
MRTPEQKAVMRALSLLAQWCSQAHEEHGRLATNGEPDMATILGDVRASLYKHTLTFLTQTAPLSDAIIDAVDGDFAKRVDAIDAFFAKGGGGGGGQKGKGTATVSVTREELRALLETNEVDTNHDDKYCTVVVENFLDDAFTKEANRVETEGEEAQFGLLAMKPTSWFALKRELFKEDNRWLRAENERLSAIIKNCYPPSTEAERQFFRSTIERLEKEKSALQAEVALLNRMATPSTPQY